MTNELVAQHAGGVEFLNSYVSGLKRSVSNIQVGETKDILKMGEDGSWTFGQENLEVAESDVFAINPFTIKHGYIAFQPLSGGLALTEDGDDAVFLYPVTEELPDVDDLPALELDKAKGKKEMPKFLRQFSVDMVCVEGPNKGAEVVYRPYTIGGLQLARRIVDDIIDKICSGSENVVPMIELFSDTYYNKAYSKDIYVPQADILEWASINDGFGTSTAIEDKSEERKPKRTKKAKQIEKVEEPEEDAEYEEDDEVEEKPKSRSRGRRSRTSEETTEPPARKRGQRRTKKDAAHEEDDVSDDSSENDEETPPRRVRGRRRR